MTELCPRCQRYEYTPLDEGPATRDAPYPALSRVDDHTDICDHCGMHEALMAWAHQRLPPPEEWPVELPA